MLFDFILWLGMAAAYIAAVFILAFAVLFVIAAMLTIRDKRRKPNA